MIKPYIEKSEFGFISEYHGISWLFGDLIDEENPENDDNFKEALNYFLHILKEKFNYNKKQLEKTKNQIIKNWKEYKKIINEGC